MEALGFGKPCSQPFRGVVEGTSHGRSFQSQGGSGSMELSHRCGLQKLTFTYLNQYGFLTLQFLSPLFQKFPKCSRKKRILIFSKLVWNETRGAWSWSRREMKLLTFSWAIVSVGFFFWSLLHEHCLDHFSQLIPYDAVSKSLLHRGNLYCGPDSMLNSCGHKQHKTLDILFPVR